MQLSRCAKLPRHLCCSAAVAWTHLVPSPSTVSGMLLWKCMVSFSMKSAEMS